MRVRCGGTLRFCAVVQLKLSAVSKIISIGCFVKIDLLFSLLFTNIGAPERS